jgi:hypothetical protein
MQNAYYQAAIPEFLLVNESEILGNLTCAGQGTSGFSKITKNWATGAGIGTPE